MRRSLAWFVYAKQPSRADGTVAPILPVPGVFRVASQIGQGNIAMHDRKRQRYRCHICGRTFSARRGTMFEGLRTSTELVVVVITLLAFGCPIQAIVQAYGLDERTVASWRDRAGKPRQRVHQGLIEQGQLNVVHVQADAHSSEGTGNGCVDGIGDDGFQPVVAGWDRQSNPC